MKIFLARACLLAVTVRSMSRRRALLFEVTKWFFAVMEGMSSNIASHSWGLMPSEEIM